MSGYQSWLQLAATITMSRNILLLYRFSCALCQFAFRFFEPLLQSADVDGIQADGCVVEQSRKSVVLLAEFDGAFGNRRSGGGCKGRGIHNFRKV